MKLFPAIDIYDRQCVRLYQGDFEQVTVYGDPVAIALQWKAQGAEYLHVVDLNGARDGSGCNLDVIGDIVRETALPVQLGGGIRTRADVDRRLGLGVARVILGTVCCEDLDFVASCVAQYGAARIACGIDCKDGKAAVRGWTEVSQISGVDLGRRMADCGIQTVIFTDISRDGALTGVNVAACTAFGEATGLQVIASGGVKSLDDLTALRREGVYGAILGKAIYQKNFSVREAMELLCVK